MLDTSIFRLERTFRVPEIFVVATVIDERDVGRWVGVEVANDAISSAIIVDVFGVVSPGTLSLDLDLTQSRLVKKRNLGEVGGVLAGYFQKLGQVGDDILVLELDPVRT